MDTFQLALDFLDDVNEQLEEVSVDAINNTADRVVQRVVNHASTELTLPSIFLRQHIRVIRRASEGTKEALVRADQARTNFCLLYTSPSPRDRTRSRMPSSA